MVTVKMDGELVVVDINVEAAFAQVYNRKERAWWDFPAADEAIECLRSHGYKTARVFAEMYATDARGAPLRKRSLSAILRNPTAANAERIHLAVFDLYSLDDGYRHETGPSVWLTYVKRYERLVEMFGGCQRIHPVRGQRLPQGEEGDAAIHDLWAQVREQGVAGVVVGNAEGFTSAEPLYTYTVGIIGYTKGTGRHQGQVGSLALGLRDGSGRYLYAGRVSTLNATQRDAATAAVRRDALGRSRTLKGVSGPTIHLIRPVRVMQVEAKEQREQLVPAALWDEATGQWEPMGKRNGILLVRPKWVGSEVEKPLLAQALDEGDEGAKLRSMARRLGIPEEQVTVLVAQVLEPEAMTFDQRVGYLRRLWGTQQLDVERTAAAQASEFKIPTDESNGHRFGEALGSKALHDYLRGVAFGVGAPKHMHDDLIGETMVRAIEAWQGKRKRPRGGESLKSYTAQILRNEWINQLRRMGHRKRWEAVERAKGERAQVGAHGGYIPRARVRPGQMAPGERQRRSTVRA
jgi:hypothetical protein